MSRCNCGCHADEEQDHGVELLDAIATYTACSSCKQEHWRAFWEATQPKKIERPPLEPYVDPPRDAQADGEDGG